MVEYVRYQGGSGDASDTHKWKSYRSEFEWAKRHTNHLANSDSISYDTHIVDPFARTCGWGTITNDIDPSFHTDFHMDAADFLEDRAEAGIQARIILFDPPFSDRMNADKYEKADTNLYTVGDGRMSRCGLAMKSMLISGGIIIKLGYNSNAPTAGLECIRICTVSFGGTRNDVIISHWIQPNMSLYSFERNEFVGEDGVIVE